MKWILLLSLAVLVGISIPGMERWYFLPAGVLLAVVAVYERYRYERESSNASRELREEMEAGRRLRAELTASEARFRRVLDFAPVAILQYDRELNIVYSNKGVEEMVGLDGEALLKVNLGKLKDDAVGAAVRKALAGERGSYQGPYRTTHSDKLLHLSMASAPLIGSDGEVQGGIAIYVDTTKWREAEEESDRIRQRYGELVRRITVGVYTFRNHPDGRMAFEFASPRFCEMLGISEPDLYADASVGFKAVHPDDRTSFLEANVRSVSTMQPFRWEGRFVVNGVVRWMRIESEGIELHDGGSTWDGVVIDKTAHHAAEMALRESEERYRELFEKTPVPMWMFDKETLRFLMVNQAACEKYGYTRDEFLELTVPDVRFPEDREQLFAALVPNGQGGWRGRSRHKTKNGEEMIVDVASREVVFGGRLQRFSVVRDVTDQVRGDELLRGAIREAEAASKAKSDFLATISHEIRTPMNAVLGLMQMAMNEEERPVQRERLKKANGAAKVLLAILNDVLDYSKLEAGQLRLEEIEFDPREVGLGVADLFESEILSKGVRFELEMAPEIPRKVLGDPLRLRQILSNLVGNASKFTKRGLIRLEVFVAEDLGHAVDLRFAVRDTGIGIALDQAEGLFNPFVQGDSSTTRKFGGTGLGLSISRALVERMGGEIRVDSKEGRGSSFEFAIRVQVVERSEIVVLDSDLSGAPSEDGSSRRILLVEDNPLNQEVGKGLLEYAGYSVVVAENGQEALDVLGKEAFDLILMDLHMPVMGGLEATRMLRYLPRCANVPVVALTADQRPGVVDDCRKAGMDAFVGKPFDPKILLEKIEALLNERAE